MNKSKRFVDELAKWGAMIGVGALIIAILVVFFDIVWRRIFSGVFWGGVDITQLCVMAAAFLSIPYAFTTGAHVSVELLDSVISLRIRRFLKLCSILISAFSIGMVFYLGWIRAMEQFSYGDTSLNLAIPMIAYWLFLLFGCVLSCLVLFMQFVEESFLFFRSTDESDVE